MRLPDWAPVHWTSTRSLHSDAEEIYYTTGLQSMAHEVRLYPTIRALHYRTLGNDVQKVPQHRMHEHDTLSLLPFLFLYCTSGNPTSHVLFAFYSIRFAIKYIGSFHWNAKYLSVWQFFSGQNMNSSTQKCMIKHLNVLGQLLPC